MEGEEPTEMGAVAGAAALRRLCDVLAQVVHDRTVPATPRPARREPTEVARDFLAIAYPHAVAAWLGGSAARGEVTETSDLDLLIVGGAVEPQQHVLRHLGWTVEVFAHTPTTLKAAFEREVRERIPPMLTIASEGLNLIDDDGSAQRIVGYAQRTLAAGPRAPSRAELDRRRFVISEAIDDLRGGLPATEQLFLAMALVREASSLYLISAGRWNAGGQFTVRELRALDKEYLAEVTTALQSMFATGDPGQLIAWAGEALDAVGGRIREGYQFGPQVL